MFAEEMCNELVSISSVAENPGAILQAVDRKGASFLDVLIECELKQVSQSSMTSFIFSVFFQIR